MEPRSSSISQLPGLVCLFLCWCLFANPARCLTPEEKQPKTCGFPEELLCHNVTMCESLNDTVLPRVESAPMLARTCYCDNVCQLYGDCCPDRVEDNTFDSLSKVRDQAECLSLDGVDFDLPMLVVTSCPASWDDDAVREYCERETPREEIFLRWPVSDTAGVVFKNVYCAVCNGRDDFVYWESKFECFSPLDNNNTGGDFQAILKEKLLDGQCKVEFSPTGSDMVSQVRPCRPTVASCPPEWQNQCVAELCEGLSATTSFVLSRRTDVLYRNYFCAVCNNDSIDACDDALEVNVGPNVSLQSHNFYPLTILLDLNSGTGTTLVGHEYGEPLERTVTDITSCPKRHVYDPYAQVCRSVLCPQFFIYVNGSCVNESDAGTDARPDCVYYSLNESEYILYDNDTIFVISSNISHEPDDYTHGPNGTLVICGNLTENYTYTYIEYVPQLMLKFDKTQTLLSLVGQAISVIALAIHFTIYLLLPQLRNLAGKNLMSLVLALFCAQLLFLFGIGRTENTALCAAIGITMHFAFLASFFWMNVMSYDIWRTFSRTSAPSTSHISKRFLRYSVYAWCSPLLIVSVAIGLNYSGTDSLFRPAYGELVCWICHRPSLLLFFGLPVAYVLVANVIFYALTIAHLYKVHQTNKILTKTNSAGERCRLLLYAKLSALMGLTWIFSFVAALADLAVVWYLFLIFNSLQGLFICLGFACNRRVVRMLGEKFRSVTRRARWYDISNEEHTKSTWLSKKMSLQHGSRDNLHKVQLERYNSKP